MIRYHIIACSRAGAQYLLRSMMYPTASVFRRVTAPSNALPVYRTNWQLYARTSEWKFAAATPNSVSKLLTGEVLCAPLSTKAQESKML